VAKKRISSVDLSWLISEELVDPGSRATRLSVAVVPDDKLAWRVIVANRGERFLTADKSDDLLKCSGGYGCYMIFAFEVPSALSAPALNHSPFAVLRHEIPVAPAGQRVPMR
jgi:hypothetical protein